MLGEKCCEAFSMFSFTVGARVQKITVCVILI